MEGFGELHPGYVWQRESGDRIVIIVDDDVEVFKRNRESLADIANAVSLRVHPREQPLIDFYEGLKGLPPIKAIGFFPLPRPKDDDHKQKQEIFAAIQQWIGSFGSSASKIWLFVDYFYGDDFDKSTISGEGFVDFWLQQQGQAEHTKIAYFSVGGRTRGGPMVRENHHEYPVISKPKLQDEGVSHYKELMSFLEIGTQAAHPIEHLFSLSETWFLSSSQGNEIALTSHHLPPDWNEAETPTKTQIAAYRASIQDALGIPEIPDAWLKSGSLQNLHEAFKHLCGAYSCGQADPQRTSRQNISTGAAYLVALMAHHRACNSGNPFLDGKDEVWSSFKQAKASLFPIQDESTAKASAKALYDFFLHLFQPKSAAASVKKVSLHEEGRAFKVQLTWDMGKSDPERSLVQLLKRSIGDGAIRVPKTASNTREASSRLIAQMAVNQNGLGSPGTIYMDGDELTIASLIIK